MLKPVAVATVFAVPVLALSACSAPEQPATTPGTTPSVWTGSPSPSASPSEGGHGQAGQGEASGEKLTAQLKLADGTTVATADIEFAGGFATLTVETTAPGKLTPGFHGLHIHSVGKCEANSVAPTGGAPGDFNSAGGHFQKAGHTMHPASGDLTSLQVRAGRHREVGDDDRRVHRRGSARRCEDCDHHSREGGQLRQHPAGALPAGQRQPTAG